MLFIGKVPSLHMFVQSPKKFTLHLPGALFFFFYLRPNRAQVSYALYFILYCVLITYYKFNVTLKREFIFFFSFSFNKGDTLLPREKTFTFYEYTRNFFFFFFFSSFCFWTFSKELTVIQDESPREIRFLE